jgi:tetratricopeptide (TPR) repeat protein
MRSFAIPMPGSCCKFLALPFLLAPLALGQASSSVLDGPPFAAPAAVIAQAARITPEKYAKVTVLFEEEKDVLDSAGRVTNTHRLIYRIETQAGIDAFPEASVAWEAFYQNQPAIRARVILTDGSIVELDPKTITDVPARNESDGTYADERIHKAPLPGLSVGAIVESETTRVDKEPFFSGGGVYRYFFEREVPILHTRLVVEAPVALPLQYRVGQLPGIAVKDESTGGIHRLVFDQGYLAPSVSSDISLPTHQPQWPWVEVATGTSWQTVAEAYRLLADPQIQPAQVKDFVHGASAPTDPQARLAFLQTLVSRLHKEVRYTGIEFGQSALQPQLPSEVLKRHYGDCKDKAALLVSMLRASGVNADLALLNAGPGRDVTPALPGMNQFDHAIVYVPAAAGNAPLWIDATAEFTRVGDLPYGDQGRLALIIAPGTKDLTLIPEATPEDSVLVDTTDFLLADYGPASAVESSHTTGHFDSDYRYLYRDSGRKELRTSLDNYVRTAYAAKALTRVETGNANDFTKPFALRLEIEKSKRGNTGIVDAVAVLYPVTAFHDLPRWFFYDPDQENQKLTADEQADREKARLRRSTEYDVQPFTAEQRYHITPPAGFLLRALPADKTRHLGPAVLTETYSTDAAGVVTSVYRFNTGKARYSTDEALELRKAVIAMNKEDAVQILFDQSGARQLAAGKVREALQIDRNLIDAHAHDALPHIRIAYALLAAGVGEQARSEARKATTLDPKSAIAFNALAWALQCSSIGLRLTGDFDLPGAIEAYQQAKALDPENLEARSNLAFLYEYDANGLRYTSTEGMKNAIQEYRDLTRQDKTAGEGYVDNLIYDLLYSRQFKEVLTELEPLPSSPVRNSLGISATAATEGVDAALQRADRVSGDAAQRSTALSYSGLQLINLRLYPQATAILSASLPGRDDAASASRQIAIIRDLKPYVQPAAIDTSPSAIVENMFVRAITNGLPPAEAEKFISRVGYADEAEWQFNLKKNGQATGSLAINTQRSGFAPAAFVDIFAGTIKISAKGDDATGYQVNVQTLGAAGRQYFVMKQPEGYRIVANQDDVAEVGNAALFFLHHGNEPEARHLLDWKRDLVHKGGGDDPLSGSMLARFWTSGESKDAEAIELASAALLAYRPNIASLLPAVAAGRDRWTPAQGKPDTTDFNLLLAAGYVTIGDGARAGTASQALLKDAPDSITALRLAGSAYGLEHDFTAWDNLLDAQLSKHPTERGLLWERARAAQEQGDYTAARKSMHTLIEAGDANNSDYNSYAWNSLFQKLVDAEALQAAQQSNMLSKNANFADLHTLACVYAAQGKTTEARQVLLQAMNAGALVQPNSEVWFAWGAIYEQYGLSDAAIQAFEQVTKPEGRISSTSTYLLAQAHLQELRASQKR